MHSAQSAFNTSGVRIIEFPETISSIVWSPDGTRLAVSNISDNRIYMARINDGETLWRVDKVGPRNSKSIAFDRIGAHVVTSSTITFGTENVDAALTLLDADGHIYKHIRDEYENTKSGSNRSVNFSLSPDRSIIAVIEEKTPSRIAIFNALTWMPFAHIEPKVPSALQVICDSERHLVAIGFVDGNVQTWDVSGVKLLRTFRALNSTLAAMVLNPGAGTVVIGGTGAIMAKRIAAGQTPDAFQTFADDPSALVSAWNPLTGDKVVTYLGPGLGVSGLAVSPDGKYVAATKGKRAGQGSYLLLWDARSGALMGEIDYDRSTAAGVEFDPDGHQVAVAVGRQVQIIPFSD